MCVNLSFILSMFTLVYINSTKLYVRVHVCKSQFYP